MKKKLHRAISEVDADHANSYTKWLTLGKPEISSQTNKILRNANRIKAEPFNQLKINDKSLELTFDMPSNAIFCLEFK